MIKQIYIKDYILIDELQVEFDQGLNVITGETGAGKSIVINAIDIVFAPRVSKDVIKSGCDKATLELILNYNKDGLNEFFEENGIDHSGSEIIITKEISQNAVRSRVNGTLVNQEFIKVLRDKLIDIHSQHQTYSFLQPKYHISLLDNYAKDSYCDKLSEYKLLYAEYKNLSKELEDAKNLSTATETQIDFLKFQIDEIENAAISDENEYEELKNESNILENAEKLKELTGASCWSLSQDDSSVLNALGVIKANISKASQMDSNLAETEEQLISIIEALKETSSSISNYTNSLEYDESKINAIQERIFILDKLRRKYGASFSEVIETYENLKKEYDKIEHSTQNIEELEAKIVSLLLVMNTEADKVTLERKKSAQVLSSLIVKKLEKLELPKARFDIAITPCEINQNGKDAVEFLISTNISEGLKPLAKVASGGEISRVMLAIKAIFAKNDEIDTVIFDEIDTGISGKTSQSVAEEISELAKYHQIILITHQPIIASKANRHFYVSKSQENTTNIGFSILSGEARINALAELAGGEINEQSLEFARSLV